MAERKCLQCGYRWNPRINGRDPKECPSCKSRNWNRQKKE